MGRETSAIKENPRTILKAAMWRFAYRLILAIDTEAAPDDPIGLQGFPCLKGSNPRISVWSIAVNRFLYPFSFFRSCREVIL